MLAITSFVLAGGLVLSGTGTALADDGTGISVQDVRNDWTNNGKLMLSLTASSAVTKVKVALVSQETGETLTTVTDFELVSGTATNGTWSNRKRIQLPALGVYRVNVSAADEGGDVLDVTGAGYFSYAVQTFLKDAKADRSVVDYNHRTVTVSGHLTGQWPGSGAVTPLGGLTVSVGSGFEHAEVTTAPDGSYTAELPVTWEYQNSIRAAFEYSYEHRFYNYSTTRDFPITIRKTPTKVVLSPTTRKVPYKGTVPSTGATLLWQTPTGWQPLADKSLGSNSFGDFVSRTTDANGNATFPATQSLWGNVTLAGGWSSDDIYLAGSTGTADITVVQPAAVRTFTASRSDSGSVEVAGELQFTGNLTPGQMPVTVQYSATGKGGWTTVATTQAGQWNGHGGYDFAATVPNPAAGFWRATYTGAPQFENAVSTAVFVAAP